MRRGQRRPTFDLKSEACAPYVLRNIVVLRCMPLRAAPSVDAALACIQIRATAQADAHTGCGLHVHDIGVMMRPRSASDSGASPRDAGGGGASRKTYVCILELMWRFRARHNMEAIAVLYAGNR